VKQVKSFILHRYGVPKAIISDRGTHFCNRTIGTLLAKYHVTSKLSTGYHPKQMAKVKSPIKRLRAYWKRLLDQARKIEVLD